MPATQDDSQRNRRTAKRILAIGLPLVVIAGTGIGYAFWTTSAGSGSGTADSAASVTPVTLVGSITGLVPGATVDVPVFAKNTNATTSVGLTTVGIATGSTPVTGSTTAGALNCDLVSGATATFTPGSLPVVVPPTPASGAGSSGTAVGTLHITMANTTTNQDDCKSRTFTVALTSS
jgi:hypothetical protein